MGILSVNEIPWIKKNVDLKNRNILRKSAQIIFCHCWKSVFG